MKLYVMRHGPAEDTSATGRDGDRALTPQGRERVRSVARALLAADEAPRQVLSSPLVRALQTAEIVAAIVGANVSVSSELAPGADQLALVDELVRGDRKRVMVVGHEPDLSMLVHQLLKQSLPQGMMKAMVVSMRLALGEDGARDVQRRFVLDPKTLVWER